MRIKVYSPEEKVRINLLLPNSLIKSKLVWDSIKKYGNIEFDRKVMKKVYKVLKDYIKENGHFVLVHVVSSNGDIVKISV